MIVVIKWRKLAFQTLRHMGHFSMTVLLVVCALALVSCESQKRVQEKKVTGKPAKYVVTAEALLNEYEENQVAADLKYKGQVIVVKGRINDIGEDILKTPYITLCADEWGLSCVQCFFADNEKPKLARLKKGQFIQVKGLCDGKAIFNVILKGCELQ